MSQPGIQIPTEAASTGAPWSLWRRQVLAVLRLEIRKNFLSKRALPIYLLALLPVGIYLLRAVLAPFRGGEGQIARSVAGYANFYQGFILRMCVFFGCVVIFSNLIRGEVLDKSLHYYFLAPIRRDILAVGKFLSGLVAAVTIFGASTAATVLLNYVPHGAAMASEHFLHGPGLSQLFWYLMVTTMACVGYGAVFLAIGLFFKNPIVPAVAILGLETINFLLPPLLKKISVVYYLQSLCPVPVSQGPFALVAEPSPVWIALPGLLVLTVVVLVLAGWRIRRFEIMYGTE